MQKWHKGPRPETVSRRQTENKKTRHKTADTTQEGIQQDPQEDPRAGDREMSSWDFQRVTKNEELELVEGSAPFKVETGSIVGIRAVRDVAAPATLDNFAPTNRNDKRTVKG
jgi:hypothetical protein